MRTTKILLIEADPHLVEMLVASFVRRFDAHITCVADASSALDVEMIDPHDLVVTDLARDYGDPLKTSRDLLALNHRPIILMANDLTSGEAVEAMRIGVRDIFRKPFAMQELLDSADRLMTDYQVRRQHAAKYHRMRNLVRRVISERRDLNRRIELICRDLVGAHRRLVHRVVSDQVVNPNPSA